MNFWQRCTGTRIRSSKPRNGLWTKGTTWKTNILTAETPASKALLPILGSRLELWTLDVAPIILSPLALPLPPSNLVLTNLPSYPTTPYLQAIIVLHIPLWLVDGLSWWRVLLGIAAHLYYTLLLRNFPVINLLSFEFIGSCGTHGQNKHRARVEVIEGLTTSFLDSALPSRTSCRRDVAFVLVSALAPLSQSSPLAHTLCGSTFSTTATIHSGKFRHFLDSLSGSFRSCSLSA